MTTHQYQSVKREGESGKIIKDIDTIAKRDKIEIKVEYTHAGLTVQGEPYRKKGCPPHAQGTYRPVTRRATAYTLPQTFQRQAYLQT